MKKIVLVALMALCGVSFSFGDSFNDCLGDCINSSRSMSNLIRKQKAVDATECFGDCKSAALQDGLPEHQSDGYVQQQGKNIYDPKGELLGPKPMVR